MNFSVGVLCRGSKEELQELSPAFYGLQTQDSVRTAGLLSGPQVAQDVAQLEQLLKDIYCGRSVSAEFSYVEVSSPLTKHSKKSPEKAYRKTFFI